LSNPSTRAQQLGAGSYGLDGSLLQSGAALLIKFMVNYTSESLLHYMIENWLTNYLFLVYAYTLLL
jgi:hypothetical protein